jgi:hypothetical protein
MYNTQIGTIVLHYLEIFNKKHPWPFSYLMKHKKKILEGWEGGKDCAAFNGKKLSHL